MMMMFSDQIRRLQTNIQSVIVGKQEVIDLSIVALLSRGHLLIEDVPGVGKTTLARSIAKSLDCSFQRIQCTPDLLPSDILGVNIYNQQSRLFEFREGPVFANIVLTDEINRATPRTQSSLLEAMSEFQVTIDRTTYPLPDPFLVIATQNPVEYEGTFPLPESQLDRFALSINIGKVSIEEERQIVLSQRIRHPIEDIQPQLTAAELIDIQNHVKDVRMDNQILDYLLTIVNATRESDLLKLGASPRGSLILYRTAQALALIRGRDYCIPDDVKHLAIPVLAHRMPVKPHVRFSGISAAEIIQDILNRIAIPL